MKPNVEPLLKCKRALQDSEDAEMHGKILEAQEYASQAVMYLNLWQIELTLRLRDGD